MLHDQRGDHCTRVMGIGVGWAEQKLQRQCRSYGGEPEAQWCGFCFLYQACNRGFLWSVCWSLRSNKEIGGCNPSRLCQVCRTKSCPKLEVNDVQPSNSSERMRFDGQHFCGDWFPAGQGVILTNSDFTEFCFIYTSLHHACQVQDIIKNCAHVLTPTQLSLLKEHEEEVKRLKMYTTTVHCVNMIVHKMASKTARERSALARELFGLLSSCYVSVSRCFLFPVGIPHCF